MSETDILVPTYEPGVTTYRVFHLDDRGGVALAQVIDALTDDEAIVKAGILANAYGLDLWERARHLGTFPPRISG